MRRRSCSRRGLPGCGRAGLRLRPARACCTGRVWAGRAARLCWRTCAGLRRACRRLLGWPRVARMPALLRFGARRGPGLRLTCGCCGRSCACSAGGSVMRRDSRRGTRATAGKTVFPSPFFPSQVLENVESVSRFRGKGKACVDLPALDAVSWRTGIAARENRIGSDRLDCSNRENALESSFATRREETPWQFRRWPAFRR